MANNDIASYYLEKCVCGHSRMNHWSYDGLRKSRCEECYDIEKQARLPFRWIVDAGPLERDENKSNHEFEEDFDDLVRRIRENEE